MIIAINDIEINIMFRLLADSGFLNIMNVAPRTIIKNIVL